MQQTSLLNNKPQRSSEESSKTVRFENKQIENCDATLSLAPYLLKSCGSFGPGMALQ